MKHLGCLAHIRRTFFEAQRSAPEVPEARLDNDSCENALRPIVLRRKNILFLGSAKAGGERAEAFFSLTQSCRHLGFDPFADLVDVIGRVSTHSASRVEELTPRGGREAHSAEKVAATAVG